METSFITTFRKLPEKEWRSSMSASDGFLALTPRSSKPRTKGITHIFDKGLPLTAIEGLYEVAGDYIDVVKLGWGSSYITCNLDEKIALYRSLETPVVCGGTLFEASYTLNKLDGYKSWMSSKGLTHVEISDGTIDLPRERKLELIADFARDFTVLSEVGSKDAEVIFAPYEWVMWIKEELEAGSWKVITEGREGGTAGIFRPSGEMREGLVEEIVHEVSIDDLIFEAPLKAAQSWIISHYGREVNLGNIPPEEALGLEALRLGLRSDTLKAILGK
jgi:phosphosulfolactate synthase